MVSNYIPDRGDILLLEFSTHSGHEQRDTRPAIVVSPKKYNAKVGLMLACPITTKQKGYPFEVILQESQKTTGVILADQIRSLDWKARSAHFIEKAKKGTVHDVLEKVSLLVR